MIILYAFLVLAGIGLIMGILLMIASRVFYVKEDKRIEEILKRLPNANCGGCGRAGCKNFAEGVVDGSVKHLSECKPGKVDKNFNPILEYLKDIEDNDIKVEI